MSTRMHVHAAAAALACLVATASGAARAQPAEQFYAGKRLTIVIGFAPGGGYDAYARLVGRYMVRHLPGSSGFIAQNMPGAGTRVAANWLYNVAPRDGTVIATLVQSTPIDQALKEPGVQFDAARFNWIGNPIVENLVTIGSTASGLLSMADVKAKGGLVCGSTGSGSTINLPRALSKLIGREIKVISGYTGTSTVILAIERGELNCLGGNGWSSTKAIMGHLLRDKKITVLTQWGAESDPEIVSTIGRDVPLATAFARDDLDRQALTFMSATSALSRPLLAPPDVPADRVELLRRAFDAAMQDPELRAEAAKADMDIKPSQGAKIQDIVRTLVTTPEASIRRAKELIE
jgi:tripartite-type tricarboxylate transporter receptor subunit TctC